MADLKKCPFCGSEATTEIELRSFGGGTDSVDCSVYCKKCGIRKTVKVSISPYCDFTKMENAMAQVQEAWNRRADDGRSD